MAIYRHGDILLRSIKGVAAPVTRTPPKPTTTLALGEFTGHAHVLRGQAAAMVRKPDTPDPAAGSEAPVALGNDGFPDFLNVLEPSQLTHEEHATIDVAPGLYEVIRQRTFTGHDRAPDWVLD